MGKIQADQGAASWDMFTLKAEHPENKLKWYR